MHGKGGSGRPSRLRALLVAGAVAALIGIPALILQRYVAETRNAAIFAVLAWFAICAAGLFLVGRRHRDLRLPAWGTYAAVLIAVVAVGYWTGFRDRVVDEEIVVASVRASEGERTRGLAPAGAGSGGGERRPVELARGTFEGADGHAGTGVAAVVQQPDGRRLLTFSRFDVDPGADVDVYLVPVGDGSDVSDRVELGDLKGNVGDQQYGIPPDADLTRYGTVVLWCKPFTVRIAVAQLSA
jgi:Electron transfer DM13